MEKRELLNQLFTWSHELDILDNKGDTASTVHQRLVGDNDLQKARKTALRYSAELRKLLRDKSSDEHLIFIDSLTDLTKEELINFILMEVLFEVRSKVERGLYVEEPQEPESGASQEEQESFVREHDNYETNRIEKLNKLVLEELQALQTTLNTSTYEENLVNAQKAKESSQCNNRLQEVYLEMVAYLGTYTDASFTDRLYPSYAKFINIAESLKGQIIQGYSKLELNSLSLKGSQNQQNSET